MIWKSKPIRQLAPSAVPLGWRFAQSEAPYRQTRHGDLRPNVRCSGACSCPMRLLGFRAGYSEAALHNRPLLAEPGSSARARQAPANLEANLPCRPDPATHASSDATAVLMYNGHSRSGFDRWGSTKVDGRLSALVGGGDQFHTRQSHVDGSAEAA